MALTLFTIFGSFFTFYLTNAQKEWRRPDSAKITGHIEGSVPEESSPQFEVGFNKTGAVSTAFFSKKTRSEIDALRRDSLANQPKTNASWFKNEPSYLEPRTNEFNIGSRGVRIVSKKPVNEEAVRQYLTEQAEIDKQTKTRAEALRLKAGALQQGLRSNEVCNILGSVPSRSASLKGKEFFTYSSHPTKTATDLRDKFPVLYLRFDVDGKLESWHFSSR